MCKEEWNLNSAISFLNVVCNTYVEARGIDILENQDDCLKSAIQQTKIPMLESCVEYILKNIDNEYPNKGDILENSSYLLKNIKYFINDKMETEMLVYDYAKEVIKYMGS